MPFFPDRATLEQYGERARARLLQFAPGRRMLTARPLRGLLLNTEQLEERVRALASEHKVVQSDGSMLLLQRTIDRNERLVNTAYRAFNSDARARLSITPAAEWLVDNIHVVTDQIREVRQDLPQGYYRKLPKLASGAYRGFPRIYGLALTIIEHTDGHLDQEQLVRCVVAYQAVAPLTMGEVWAVPIMLRLGLIDNIGRLANLTLDARELRVEADAWAERVLAERSTTSGEGHPILHEIEQKYPQLLLPFVVQLLRRLRGHEGEVDVAALVAWIERQPALPYNTAEELIHAENQRQAANQVSVANTITSMRMLNAIDWETWFERVCLVEQVLRQDPNGTYARGTFATRDRYRHELEVLARGSRMSELDLARLLIDHAQQARRDERAEAEGHIGYYLVDDGRKALEREIGFHPKAGMALQRGLQENATAVYFGAVAGTTAALVGAGLRIGFGAARRKHVPAAAVLGTAALLALPASAMAFELVNRGLTRILKPRVLPRLDLRSGIPDDLRTMVVVPTLLLTPDSVRHQLESLEVLYLANEDPHLHFALLSDFADALEPHSPDDDALLALARQQVQAMNERYGADRFLLLHRRRVWNEQQGRWMGWERKRGKLEEFNRLLAGDQDTTFEEMIGDLQILPQIRYVITLDSDTQLPRDAAQALIGTIAHPLNRAEVDPQHNVVTRGYGILQPRVGIDVASATASRFARTFAGNIGVDPYTMAVSDVYMDLFGEGIYAGKGIYDPQVLRETLHGRFPENALLSHDLIEGNYARAGLLSDIELLDGYPTTYAAYAARQHRWVRGDWQIARWLLPRVPDGSGKLVPNVLSPLARYKIFDNLRRSLVPPAIVTLLGAGWLALPGRPAVWTALALSSYAAPLAFSVIDTLLGVRTLRALRALPEALRNLRLDALRALLNMALLPDQAVLNVDAIVRTLVRLGYSRRNLLEWETAAQSGRRLTSSEGYLRRSSFPAIAVVALGSALRPEHAGAAWQAAAPVLASWAAAPSLAGWLDQPYLAEREPEPGPDDRVLLRSIARATYTYFERFVNEEGSFLAPDNFQETPNPVVAFRTSPTNIGLQLLADLSAFDFGYLGVYDLLERIERVFSTMEQLERYRGHLFNWYDTKSLRPLNPRYVSTVDSGNLAGSLLALRQGLLALHERPVAGEWMRHGLLDLVELIDGRVTSDDHGREVATALRGLLGGEQTSLEGYRAMLEDVVRSAGALEHGAAADLVAVLAQQAESHLRDLMNLGPHGMPHTVQDSHGRYNGSPAAEHAMPLLGELEIAWPALHARISALAAACSELVNGMDFRFLYEEQRKIFTIGYNVSDNRRDNSYYDLLASENRLASFVAIAKGDVPQEHWFHIGRTLTPVTPTPTLISWSGTMFEYLMPLLVMRNYPETLLDSTYRGAVARQIAYGREQDVPWGISESGFNARDLSMNYQYRAFGVPGLGLQSGLGNDLVIAPYATVLALPVQFEAAMANIQTLIDHGMFGQCGLYEAIDFTPDRLPPGSKGAIVRSYMVHHQGMSLVAINNVLHNARMQQRFHAEPIVQATEMLLQEKIPHSPPLQLPEESSETPHAVTTEAHVTRQFTTPHTAVPYAHTLASGAMAALFTTGGGGFLRYRDLMVTRWRADATCDNWGSWIYVRDARSGLVWSPAYQPVHEMGDGYRVTFALEKVEYHQRVAGIDTRMEIAISPEDEVEVRRVTLTNLTSAPREIEVTSYAEIVLAQQGADTAHPAFANLFVETEYVDYQHSLLASRRPRSATAERVWAGHVAAVRGFTVGDAEYETNRVAFLGRGRSTADPEALGKPLGGSTGAVLDPIFSLRRKVRIVPGGSAQIIFATVVGSSRDQVLRAMERYRDPLAAARAYEMAWTQTRVELRHLGLGAEDVHRFQRLASLALYPDRVRRAAPDILEQNTRGQPALWAYGISGDYPVIVARVVGDDMALIQELIRAHEYWRLKGMMIDLVLLNEDVGGYRQARQDELLSLVRSSRAGHWLNERGGIFVLRADLMPEEDRVLLQTVARVVLSNRRGDLAQHLRRRAQDMAPVIAAPRGERTPPEAEGSADLQWIGRSAWNGLGGFSEDGHEYVIDLHDGQATPAPWSNVIANEQAGFIVSERGSSYTWAVNSRENRLTPWSNDPASDPSGEALYLRNEDSGALWSPVPQPSGAGVYRVRHGFGYTSFEHHHGPIASLVTLTVAPDDPLKLTILELRNHGDEPVRLSTTMFVEWVLGVLRDQMAPYVITELGEGGALLARNPYNVEFGQRVAFLAGSEPARWVSGDRGDFIGRNGVLSHPAALHHGHHPSGTGSLGAGFDPCGVWHSVVELAPGASHTLVFALGQGADRAAAQRLAREYTQVERARQALDATRNYWRNLVDAIQVRTPQPEIDVLLNGWLLYQTLACRVLARSAFYQSGGAYGYRDQLQDVMALVYAAPELARAQIVLHASRQFVQGDVQHWWHPPSGRGIRTTFSDDYLWLAFVTLYYVHASGDNSVLDDVVPFLEGRPLKPEEDEYYDLPTVSEERAAVYDHCVRAIEYGLGRMGQHGLPLMGSGDWNDGMNRVGNEGRGESVWVGWFQLAILPAFANLAEERGDTHRAVRYRAEAERLRNALEAHAWDGEWYLRAFYDDGTPLGSARSDECQIDSLSQSWSVLSGGDVQRARQGMRAVDTLLVDRDAGLIRLFTPAFDQSDHNPGYIKGYVPGVRENGGQYTHAAIWVIWAFAQLGEGRRALELFELINPVRHGTHDLERYHVEPYVVAADVYTAAGHLGRGGWTWYTGSAGWLYRLGIEMILGVRRLGDELEIAPCVTPDWQGYELTYRFGGARYHVVVERAAEEALSGLTFDGQPVEGNRVPLRDDGATHEVRVVLAGDAATLASNGTPADTTSQAVIDETR